MKKQNGYHENLLVSKTQSVQISAYSNIWTEWIGLSEFKKMLFKVTILSVWVGEEWWWWWWWVCGEWVCVRVNEVCIEVTWCVGVAVGVCLWCGWVGEWVLDKWHSLYVNTHYEYSVLNSIWTKSGLSEFWKNNLQFCVHLKKKRNSFDKKDRGKACAYSMFTLLIPNKFPWHYFTVG